MNAALYGATGGACSQAEAGAIASKLAPTSNHCGPRFR